LLACWIKEGGYRQNNFEGGRNVTVGRWTGNGKKVAEVWGVRAIESPRPRTDRQRGAEEQFVRRGKL